MEIISKAKRPNKWSRFKFVQIVTYGVGLAAIGGLKFQRNKWRKNKFKYFSHNHSARKAETCLETSSCDINLLFGVLEVFLWGEWG